MNIHLICKSILVASLALVLATNASGSEAHLSLAPQVEKIGNTFSYQGHLTSGNNQVDANCDFLFSLWDAESGPIQVGTTLAKTILVKNGLFTANLDFGLGAFNGETRWLEITVRCPTGVGSYTTLGRQAITAAPYASYSLEADHALDADYALNSNKLDGHHASDFLLPNQSITNTLSVSTADFTPGLNMSCSYTNQGFAIWGGVTGGGCIFFMTGLELPDGVRVTKITFYWNDQASQDGQISIVRNNFDGTSPLTEAYVDTYGNTNSPNSSSATTSFVVDNREYAYYFWMWLPTNIIGYGVTVEYTFP
jgi:hypothetical protein